MSTTPTNHDLISLLAENPEAELHFVLPDEEKVPAHFHVTEVGRVQKDFIDCGGTVRRSAHCQLQLLVATDVDHRLSAEKLGRILKLSDPLFEGDALPLVVEHGSEGAIAYPVIELRAESDRIEFALAMPHPACLAADKCGLTYEEAGTTNLVFNPVATDSVGCAPGSGCC